MVALLVIGEYMYGSVGIQASVLLDILGCPVCATGHEGRDPTTINTQGGNKVQRARVGRSMGVIWRCATFIVPLK